MMHKTTKTSHTQVLLQDPRTLYHTQDLAVLWRMSNPNTLHTTAARYVRRGILHRIYRGFYATVSPGDIDPKKLGLAALHSYGYVSTETVLVNAGIIFQEVQAITLVSDTSKTFSAVGNTYRVRKMKDEYLYNEVGVDMLSGGLRRASPERAVADMLYFNPDYYFDGADRIDWQRVKDLQEIIGYAPKH